MTTKGELLDKKHPPMRALTPYTWTAEKRERHYRTWRNNGASTRLANVMLLNGFFNLHQVSGITKYKALSLRNLGKRSCQELEELLERDGLSFYKPRLGELIKAWKFCPTCGKGITK